MAHLAISDLDGKRYLHAERFARGALGLAGATLASELEPDGTVQIWLRDWRMTIQGNERPTLTLVADAPADDKHPAFGVDLLFDSSKPVVLNGDRGLSQKGSEEGNASLYYALTRLATKGQLTIGDQRFTITGDCWLDREWSTSALEKGQQGWDWFALHLHDGRSIMAFRLRRKDGLRDAYDHGILVTDSAASAAVVGVGDAGVQLLEPRHYELIPQRYWSDPGGSAWPVSWTLRLGDEILSINAMVDDQRMDTSVIYWEGIVAVQDEKGRDAGRGYMELTGYAD